MDQVNEDLHLHTALGGEAGDGLDLVAVAIDDGDPRPAVFRVAAGSGYQSTMAGPGSSPANFVTTSPWFSQLGHGYSLHELWTYDNGTTADSTATWTYRGAANTSYLVCAFIPDNYANNTAASYVVTTSASIPVSASVSQANVTNAFTRVAAVTTGSDGAITVELNDTGPTGRYTVADAMEFLPNGTAC